MEELDRQDVVLLNELQRDSHQTVQQLAERVGLSSTPCWKRIKEMEGSGVIRGYTALIDREKVGLALCVIAELNLTRHNQEVVAQFEQEVADCAHIVGCYATTGQADYVIKVLMPDIKAYERFLHETVFKLPGVTHVRSSVVLKEVKAEMRLPIEAPAKPAAARRVGSRAQR
jgi:Lrp/AsnC family leucine-responsive transcriptional regulator